MNIAYKIKFSKRRTVTITVERDCSVIVRAPVGTAPERIDRLVEKKKLWLYEKTRHPQKYRDLPHPPGKELVAGEAMPYLGRFYRIEWTDEQTDEIRFLNKFLIPRSLGGGARQALRDWYMAKAREKIFPRVTAHAHSLGVEVGQVKLSCSRYRWGSCTPSDNIILNWRLIKAPMPVIDYVSVHELAHLLEANHTPRFWNIVRTHVPKYEQAKSWLKENGALLEQDI